MKGYGARRCLLMMLETWKEATDNNKVFGALSKSWFIDF